MKKSVIILILLFTALTACTTAGKAQNKDGSNNSSKKTVEQYIAECNKLLGQKKYDAALLLSSQAIKEYPQHYKVHNMRGMVYHLMGKFDRALTNYKKAVSLNQKFMAAYNNIGVI